MNNRKYQCFLVKNGDGILLKFSYDSKQGIYYEMYIKEKWSEKKNIYKESFENFYVLMDLNYKIHVFCQDICGDIILCTLEGMEWKYKTLLHMKYNIITPIEIKAFFSYQDIHLLYKILDKNTNSEFLVHQVAKEGVQWGYPSIIDKLDYYSRFDYHTSSNCRSNTILLNTMSEGVYKLMARNYNINEYRWGKEEIIYKSLLPYIDSTIFVEENRKHYLFIIQDNQFRKVIYQCKEIGLPKNIILFEHEEIDSCLIVLLNEVLWTMWISEDKLYGCFSIDYGKNFNAPRVYRYFSNILPKRGLYQECLIDKENKYISNDIYIINFELEEKLNLNKNLESQVAIEIDNKN